MNKTQSPTPESTIHNPQSAIDDLLSRPPEQRVREYKYRLAQTLVFGLPVIVLQYLGPRLGGAESERWVGVLQAILTGWIVYVGAAGMAFEGAILLARRRPSAELLVATVAVLLFGFSAASVTGILVRGELWFRPLLFHWTVIVLAAWCAGRLCVARRG